MLWLYVEQWRPSIRAWSASLTDGTVLIRPELSTAARTALNIESAPRLPNLQDAHRANLAAHRTRRGFSGVPNVSPPLTDVRLSGS